MAKNNEEKVIIRKCHHCGKIIDEDKDFCLHCGHVYQEIDKDAVRAERNAKLKKLFIKLSVYAAIAAVIGLVVFFIVRAALKSDYYRVVEYLKEECAVSENLYRAVLKEETDKNAITYISCTDVDTESFILAYEERTKTFDTVIKVYVTAASPSSYRWECSFIYHDEKQQAYNFEEHYTGTLEPATFTTKEGTVFVDVPVVPETETETDIETDIETESQTESEVTELVKALAGVFALSDGVLEPLPDDDILEPLPDDETESETETETETEGEEGEEGEDEGPTIDPDSDIREAASRVVALQVRQMIYELYVFVNEQGIWANLEGLGFVAYYDYIQKLNPLKQ